MSIDLTRDFDTLQRRLFSLCTMVEGMIQTVVNRLGKPTELFARELAKQNNKIDCWNVQFKEERLKLIALHEPVAIPLRCIATVLKITRELIRVADLGVHLAEHASRLVPETEIFILDKLKESARVALEMLHCVINAVVVLDSKMTRKVCTKMLALINSTRKLFRNCSLRCSDLPVGWKHLFSVPRHVKRVADHTTIVVENVVHFVEREIIRHQSFSVKI